ncbi:hypothetical protein D3C85_1486430 [compost metagenome]
MSEEKTRLRACFLRKIDGLTTWSVVAPGLSVRYWPILLERSAMVCASEKYASEIEVFTFGKGIRTRTSRNNEQKKVLSPVNDQAVWADRLFKRIGR